MHNPNVKWDDIIGLDAAKRLVKEAVVYPIMVWYVIFLTVEFTVDHFTVVSSVVHRNIVAMEGSLTIWSTW